MALPDDAPRPTLFVATLLVAGVYLCTAARAVLGGDNGEFATLFAEGGVAHPSGYPLYVLWLRALSWIPSSSPAHGAALATACVGALAVGMMGLAARAWGASRYGALFAMGAWAFASLPWRLATHAEVFSLHALLVLGIVMLAGPDAPWRGVRRAVGLAFVAGLALSNHLSSVLLAPVGLYGVARALHEDDRPWRTLVFAALAMMIGLTPYVQLYVSAHGSPERLMWGDTRSLAGVVRHVLRRDYGTLSLSASTRTASAWSEEWFFVRSIVYDLHVLPAVLSIVGFVALEREANDAVRRRARYAYAATLLLAGPLFIARFNISPEGVGAAVVERFQLMPGALLAVMCARGFDLLAERAPLGASVRCVLAAAVALMGFARGLPVVRDDHRDTVERYLLDTLDTLPPNAVVLGTGDHRTLGFPYVQRALAHRRDVLFIDPRLLPLAPYRARIERAMGRRFAFAQGPSVPTVSLAETALATQRPLYLTDVFTPAIARALPTYPEGTVIRVLPRGQSPPSADALIARNDALYRRYRLQPTREVLPPWQALAQQDYARTWHALADAALHARRPDVAAPLRARALAYTPITEESSR